MAVGMAPAVASEILNAIFQGTAFTTLPEATVWIKLHIGDPGADGTGAPALNATRKDVTAAMSAAAGGAITSDTAITWTTGEVTDTETYSHFTIWDASTAGNFVWSGTVTGGAVTAGNQFSLPIGDLDFSVSVAAA